MPISLLMVLRCCLQSVAPSFGSAELSVQFYDFIHKRQFSSWNFFLIFSLTNSGFVRINLMSSIFSTLSHDFIVT